jgi:hypothetical protein
MTPTVTSLSKGSPVWPSYSTLLPLGSSSCSTSELLNDAAVENPFGECRVYVGDIYGPSLSRPYVLPSTALVRRSCFEKDLRFNGNYSVCGDDWEFFARASRRHGAAYLDVETTLNRSHEDAVRLTRVSRTIRAERRVRMIERVWGADQEYYTRNQHEVEGVWSQALLDLAKSQLLDGDSRGARSSIRQLGRLSTHRQGIKGAALGIAAAFPGAAPTLRLLHRLLRAG